MSEEPLEGDSLERREESARHALHAYRERRRRRRAEDTFFGSLDVLVGSVHEGLEEREIDRRRSELVEEAEERGMSRELAELLYDIALEEGLDPALAYELVCTGLGVAPPPEGVSNAPADPMVDKYLPSWMFPPEPTDKILRERMLRTSFRRLRSILQEVDDVDEAFRSFANEPDVGHYGY